jgi:CheY-like chemotaxis protein
VVDDVAANRLLLAAALAHAGFSHAEAADGATAVAMAAQRDFAAVLMDVQMPGMDGLEATRRIRALPPPAGRLRVIGITADRSPEGEAAARAAGMDDFLAKPVSVADLARVLAPARV